MNKASHQLSDSVDYAVSSVAVRCFVEDLGLFVKDHLASMDRGNHDTMFQLSVATILGLVNGISAVVAEKNEDNEAYINAGPGVATHQLFRILPGYLSVYLYCYGECLKYTVRIGQIDNISRQHKALYDTYRRQPELNSSIDRFYDGGVYRNAWNGLHNAYSVLESFVGGLATIFPCTSTVERNFLVVKYKGKKSIILSGASLKGILHEKQYQCMRSLGV